MFSDYAYLDRAVMNAFLFTFVLHRIHTTIGYDNIFNRRVFQRMELKNLAMFLLIISQMTMFIYDVIALVIKYREGYYVDPVTGLIITRPLMKYAESDRRLFPAIGVLQNISMTLQCSAVFLMMALWNHMSKAMLNRQFMSSVEFKAYFGYSIAILAIYPVLQVVSYVVQNVFVSNVLPLFLYCSQLILIVVLTQINNIRFRRLLKLLPSGTKAYDRVGYYTQMNNWLAFVSLLNFVGLFAITIDIVSTAMFSFNKILMDIFSKLFMLGYCSMYPIAFMIILPSSETKEVRSKEEKEYLPSSPKPGKIVVVSSPRLKDDSPLSPPSPSSVGSPRLANRDTRGYFKLDPKTGSQIFVPILQ